MKLSPDKKYITKNKEDTNKDKIKMTAMEI
jgi:hypothetical protein